MMKTTSILTKVLMALTGLAWIGFLVGHLSGNFLIFKGAGAFNAYAEFLESTGVLLYIAEAGLVLFLGTHIWAGIKATRSNSAARPQGYSDYRTTGKSSFASRTMIVGGIILTIFVVTHVGWFKFGPRPEGDLWLHVITSFKNPIIVGWYILAMLALGLHLSHGFGSAFQTLGIFKPAWRDLLKKAGLAFGWAIALGFISFPVWAYFVAELPQ